MFKEFNINIPWYISDFNNLDEFIIKEYWIKKNIETLKVINENIINNLKINYPNIEFIFDLNRIAWIGYYHGICFKIVASNINWQVYPLVDWWLSDWTQKILVNNKERLLVSWIWSELFMNNFKLIKT